MRKWLALASFLLLAACISPEEQAARDAAQRHADEQDCQSLGFRPGSNAFANCMLKLREIRAQEANTRAIDRANDMPPPWWGPRFGPPYWW